jgi:hypothetical protein
MQLSRITKPQVLADIRYKVQIYYYYSEFILWNFYKNVCDLRTKYKPLHIS